MKPTYLITATLLSIALAMPAFADSGAIQKWICTVSEHTLQKEIYQLEDDWERAKQRYSQRSQYRQRIEERITDTLTALTDAKNDLNCNGLIRSRLDKYYRRLDSVL
jgi:hypothetical protein